MQNLTKYLVGLALIFCALQVHAQFPSNGNFPGAFGGGFAGGGRSNTYSGSDYGTSEARSVHRVLTGMIADLRIVTISSRSGAGQYVGAGIGGALGAIAGRKVGRGSGRDAASVVAGTIGALAGQQIGNHLATSERRALEVVVTLDSGELVAVTQEIDADAAALVPGMRVGLIQGQNTRVVRLQPHSDNRSTAQRIYTAF